MFRKKGVEQCCVAAVARIRGGTPKDESGEWPDGWIEGAGGERIRVEVVSALPEADASAWAHAYTQAAAEARRIQQETETPVSWTVQNGRGIVFDGRTEMPVSTRPINPIVGILAAVSAKAQKYGRDEASTAILVVHHVHYPSLLDEGDLRRISDHAVQIGAQFREIWIVNEYGYPAQRVPFDGPCPDPDGG